MEGETGSGVVSGKNQGRAEIREEQKSGSTSFRHHLVNCMEVLSVWGWEGNLLVGFGDGSPVQGSLERTL